MSAIRCVEKTSHPTKPQRRLSIGQLAEAASTSPRTIRYYEELGVLPRPERTPAGTRQYPADYIALFDGIKILKDLGFGLGEIAALVADTAPGTGTTRAQASLERRIAELTDQQRFLRKLADVVCQVGPRSRNFMPARSIFDILR